jgi:general secretion pathway protein D
LILTPTVITNQADLRKIFERKMQERQEFLDRYFVFSGQDWKPPRDYSRTNGLVEDIRQAYMQLDERVRLEEEASPTSKKEHKPSEPIELPHVVKPGGAGAAPTPPPAARPRPRPRPRPRTNPARPPTPRPAPRPRTELAPPAININPVARSVNAERVE